MHRKMASMTKKEVFEGAMALPPEERARLAHDIIASLDTPPDGGAAEEWVREIERRIREVKEGSAKLVNWKEARARILKRLSTVR
jgi:putative addiction module component (TIGR02574 family)